VFRYTLECISEKVGNYLLEFICAACYYLLMGIIGSRWSRSEIRFSSIVDWLTIKLIFEGEGLLYATEDASHH